MDDNHCIDPAFLDGGSDDTSLDQQFQPCGCTGDLFCGRHGGFSTQNMTNTFDLDAHASNQIFDDSRPFSGLDMPLPPLAPNPSLTLRPSPWDNTPPPLRIQTAPRPVRPTGLQQIQDTAGTRDPLLDYFCNTDTFTPGFRFSPSVISPTNYPVFTPVTTVPSIAEEDQSQVERISCPDFLGKARQQVQLQGGNSTCYEGAKLLAEDIRSKGYHVKLPEGPGDKASLSALHMGMSSSMPNGQFPPPIGKLQLLLQNTRRGNGRPSDDPVAAASLFTVLKQCGDDLGVPFQMGVICGVEEDVYEVTMHRDPRQWNVRTIWMFYDVAGNDTGCQRQWSAIIPRNLPSTNASWARVAAAPRPPPQAPAQPSGTGLLHPGYSPSATRSHHTQVAIRPQSGARSRSGRGSRPHSVGAIPLRGRLSSRSSRASSVSGTIPTCDRCSKTFETHTELIYHQRKYAEKSHFCTHCGTGFLYPKDLRRHEMTHSGCKPYKCHYCPKTYSRSDNMKRHMKTDHGERTPPSSNGAGGPA